MNRTLKMFAALAPLVAFAPVAAQSNANAPVVAVIGFDNAAFGPAAKDYEGIGKAITDLVITDLASTSKVRVVERARMQAILDEQNLAKTGAVDAATAVRVGRLFNACYSVTGSFVRNDKTGENSLVLRTYSNETSAIANPIRVDVKGDDMMQLIARATAQFIRDLNLTACPGTAGTGRSADNAAPAAQQQASSPAPAASAAATKSAAPVHVEYAKVLKPDEIKKVQSTKLDARTMLIYSRALDAKDRKDNARAKQLAQQVLDKYKDFSPARDLLQAASAGN
jgi:TolB-like protein